MDPDLGVHGPRKTLVSGYFHRIVVGHGRLSILADRNVLRRTSMTGGMAIGAIATLLGVAVSVAAAQRGLEALDAGSVAAFVVGVIGALGGCAVMVPAARTLDALERSRTALDGFDVLGEADFATGTFYDRQGARFPLSSVRPLLQNRSDAIVLVFAWARREIVIGNEKATVGTWSLTELRALTSSLHQLGFAPP